MVIETNTAGELYTDDKVKELRLDLQGLETDFKNNIKRVDQKFMVQENALRHTKEFATESINRQQTLIMEKSEEMS